MSKLSKLKYRRTMQESIQKNMNNQDKKKILRVRNLKCKPINLFEDLTYFLSSKWFMTHS